MLDKKQVRHIAELARLGLTEKDISKFQEELSGILDFVKTLQKLDVSLVAPMAQATESFNVLREDKVRPSAKNKGFFKHFLKNLPEKENGYIKVPSILE